MCGYSNFPWTAWSMCMENSLTYKLSRGHYSGLCSSSTGRPWWLTFASGQQGNIRFCSYVLGDLGHLPFTQSIQVKILNVNIQCCSLSKHKINKSPNVLVCVGILINDRKSALIKPIAHNFWNFPHGMVCTIFSNQNFRVFCVNGNGPWISRV